ncbi:hypothetical protein BGW41_004504 [Actinomortierella wolfii]|nr:hypothetical protein BGW41_004504 [Actinomortierella wolfii]
MSAAAYPSPSLSPATSFEATMKTEELAPYHGQRRSSVKHLLMNSSATVSSPLDALVLALEATAEELENGPRSEPTFPRAAFGSAADSADTLADDEEDPNATVPSSPTFFMKKPSTGSSLHQLPTLILPGPAAPVPPVSTAGAALSLTPSTNPRQQYHQQHQQAYQSRKMSVSSQGSSTSSSATGSSSERKSFHCTVAGCDKAFSQMSHLRTHER